ncbi:GntR family transcriptional regulator [Pseudonocardia sp.]|uniref:GntR family transcriptional regulator n=1 Tax=Pseudonocardia sp. TaxID=60912 RepID=UPI003D11EFC7
MDQAGGASASFEAPPTRREAVAQRLRSEIVSGALPSGSVLKDAELAARLGVSITPVREAITQLAAEGLIDISPNRTRKVAGLSQKQALELVDVMRLLACEGFERGVENLTDEHIASMRKRYTEYVDALGRGDITTAGAAGADFSTIVIMAGGNRELQSLVDLVVTRSLRIQAMGADSPIWIPWVNGYRETLELLEAGERHRAVARYRQIYADYRTAVEEWLWSSPGGRDG